MIGADPLGSLADHLLEVIERAPDRRRRHLGIANRHLMRAAPGPGGERRGRKDQSGDDESENIFAFRKQAAKIRGYFRLNVCRPSHISLQGMYTEGMIDLTIHKVDPDDWDRLNENFEVITAALNDSSIRIALLREEVEKLRASKPVGNDDPATAS